MQRVRFGRTELLVSRVALGGIPIIRVAEAEAVAVVREALALGINFIDTANAYADSEAKIGVAIRGVPRDELVLATKSQGTDPATLTAHLDNSLKMLGVDYVDIFQLHNVSTQEKFDFALDEEWGGIVWLKEQVQAGKIRFPAFSSHSVSMALKIMETNYFDAVQLPLNYIDREAEKALELAQKLDMGFIAMKPMGGGLLSDAGVSFRYLMQFEGIVPDPGIEKIEELREIVAVVKSGEGLRAEDEAEIARLREELGASWCHRCDYCQPCPQGIPISSVLVAKSTFKRYNASEAHGMTDHAVELARGCTQCGTCLPRCPYNLNIPELMKENVVFFDGLTV